MQTGDRLAHYEILGPLGEGGMGTVLRARDLRLDREVAVKLLRETFADDAERHARFHREAQLLASFSHPNVATVHSLEEAAGQHFLVMELVEGETLADRLARGALPVGEALAITAAVAAGLEAAHGLGIVHRDLKPSNVMLLPGGGVKVLDFGLAKLGIAAVDASDPAAATVVSPTLTFGSTEPGTLLGTAAYMSPEQARSRPVDRRTDIWALGCVLYEMLAGHRAFPGETVSDTLATVLREEPDWASLPPRTPVDVARVLRRCLMKDVRRRLHDMADLRVEVEDAADDLASGSARTVGDDAAVARAGEPSGAPGRTRPAGGTRTWLVLAVLWLGSLALMAWSSRGDRSGGEVPRVRNVTYSSRDWSPSAAPDGHTVAFASDRDGRSRIWLKQMRGGAEVPLTEGPDDLPRFSPDGSQILFVRDEAGGRNLYRVAAVGGQARKILDDVVEADWAPDGQSVAFLRMIPESGRNRLVVGIADLRNGTERMVAGVENRAFYGVRWSPDGRQLAVCEASLVGNVAEASTLNLVDISTGERRRVDLTGWLGPYTAVAWLPGGDGFVVGQATDELMHVLSTPAQIFRHDLASGHSEPLFWAPVRVPRGGWGFSTLGLLAGDRVVLDTEVTRATLRELIWDDLLAADSGSAPTGSPDGPRGRALTRGLGRDRQPTFSPDGSLVAFSSNRSGNVDLWVVDRATGELRQITDDPADDWDPAFSPDGRQILWSSNRDGAMEIWIASADGGGARQVSDDEVDAENPTMTADGQWIVYASSHDEKLGIWKIRPDGTDAERLLAGSVLLPDVSPDGRHALFVRYLQMEYVIEVLDVATGELVDFRIATEPTQRHLNVVLGRARWTPDGRAIVFVGQDREGRTGVYVQDFVPGEDTRATRRPLVGFTGDFVPESLGISPDGERLVVSAMVENRSLELADRIALDLDDPLANGR
jgi:Tol biopolymer transport system component